MDNTELQEQLVRIKQQLEDCREENNRKLKTAYEDCANIKQGLEKKVQKMMKLRLQNLFYLTMIDILDNFPKVKQQY